MCALEHRSRNRFICMRIVLWKKQTEELESDKVNNVFALSFHLGLHAACYS